MKKTLLTMALAIATISTGMYAAADHQNVLEDTAISLVKETKNISPFCLAVAKGDIDTVRSLISLGANVNEKSSGMTPSMYAARYNRVEILNLLITHGADLKVKSRQGFTAKKYAELSGAKEALAVINEALSS